MKNSEYMPELSENVKIYVPGSFAPPSSVVIETDRESDEVKIYNLKRNGDCTKNA